MGLDVYISKRIFIGTMYKSCGITGEIHLFKHGKEIPVVLENVSYVIEQIYHGHKTWWLLEWLNRELDGVLSGDGEDHEISREVLTALCRGCSAVLRHKGKQDFNAVCKAHLGCQVRENIDKESLGFFLQDIQGLKEGIERALGDQDVTFMISASW